MNKFARYIAYGSGYIGGAVAFGAMLLGYETSGYVLDCMVLVLWGKVMFGPEND